MNPPWLRALPDGVTLAIRVQPRASQNAVGSAGGAELPVRIAAPPVDDAANDELVRFLARVLRCPRGAVQVRRGHHSRHKLVEIRGLPVAEVMARLLAP